MAFFFVIELANITQARSLELDPHLVPTYGVPQVLELHEQASVRESLQPSN